MPRQRSSRPAPSRSAPSGARSASTMAAPARSAPPAAAPSASQAKPNATGTEKPPGLLSQMAATAGGVAIGSTVGHGISSLLFGGSNASEQQQQQPVQQQQQRGGMCDVQAKDFTLCLEKADLQSCSYYLEQLKACQTMASQY